MKLPCFFISLLFLFLFLPQTLWAPEGQGSYLFTTLASVIITMASTEWAYSRFLLDEEMYYAKHSMYIIFTPSL